MASILLDAVYYPMRKLGWVIVFVVCAAVGVAALEFALHHPKASRLFLVTVVMFAIVVQGYLTVISNTLTDYGDHTWQGSGFDRSAMWTSLGSLLVLLASLAAVGGLVVFLLKLGDLPLQPLDSILGLVLCDYFCMAVVGYVVFGNGEGMMPQHVLPAMFKAGAASALTGIGLAVPPAVFYLTLRLWPDAGYTGIAVAALLAGYLLVTQARLAGLIYLREKDRIGWE